MADTATEQPQAEAPVDAVEEVKRDGEASPKKLSSRSRSRSPRSRSRSPRSRSRSGSKDRKSRSRSRSRSADRRRRRSRSRSPRTRRSRSRSRGRRGGDWGEKEPKKLYVGNLNFRTTESDLRRLFEEYGNVEDVYLPMEHGTPRGFGFVTFVDRRDAEAAADSCNGRDLDGRPLRVNIARARGQGGPSRGGGGSSYRGGGGGRGGSSDEPCRDFQRGNCTRSYCRYSHSGDGGDSYRRRSRSRSRSRSRRRSYSPRRY